MDEEVRRFLITAAASEFPAGARFGSADAADYLRARREQQRRRPRRKSPELDTVDEVQTDTGIALRVYRAGNDAGPRPLVVYFHGGGWVMGGLDMHDSTCRTLAVETGAVVANVAYRLAPENPYPVPFDDCYDSTQWLIEHADTWGVDSSRVALAGTSAGGNLAAAVAIRRRDAGEQPLSGLVLLYPVLDCRMSTPSYRDKERGYLLTADELSYFWDAYVQDGRDRTYPWLSPGLVDDLAGLPPTLVLTAEHDPLRDEGDAFAHKLAGASLLLDHVRASGQIHGYLTAFPDSAPARAGIAAVVAALRAVF